MTAKQNSLYWREWAAARMKQPEAGRHALHIRALGADKSHTEFSNEDFDKVLAAFRAISKPDDLNSQLRQIRMPRTRQLHAVRHLVTPAYAAEIAFSKFGERDLEKLTDTQLDQLRITLHERARAKARKAQKAEVPF